MTCAVVTVIFDTSPAGRLVLSYDQRLQVVRDGLGMVRQDQHSTAGVLGLQTS